MTILSNSSSATASTATEGDVKTFLDNLRTFMADLLGTDSANKGAALARLGAMLHGTVAKSSAYTVVAADRGKVINCTGSGGWTLNFQAAATLGDGFVFAVSNVGTGVITLDPNLAEQVNGQNTFSIAPTDTVIVYCTGSEFLLFGKSPYPGNGCQLFTASGVFTVPIGVRSVKVTVAGAGGGGGGALATGVSGASATGGMGGPGRCGVASVVGLIGGSTVAVTVGTGGPAGSDSPSDGSAGGLSSFGAYISAAGGGGGGAAYASSSSVVVGMAGAGGVVTGATYQIGVPAIGISAADIRSGAGVGGRHNTGGTSAATAGKDGFVLVEW